MLQTKNIYLIVSGILFFLPLLQRSVAQDYLEIPVAEYQKKVYSSWLGQIIGNTYGLPHENRYISEPGSPDFPYGYQWGGDWLRDYNGAFSDDDTDIEYMYLLAMEKNGIEPTYAQLTESWLYHVRDLVWLANRAALGAMHYGYTPPVTGMKQFNPHWFQIDPQLVNEIWSVTAPGMVQYAVEKSGWAAQITSDDWGIEPTMHYGAMYAAAFFESDIYQIIDQATAALPAGSRFAQTVEDMKALYQQYPNDWQTARRQMMQKYYLEEPSDTRTIWNANLNGACGILALLYGGGDFQRTLDLACAIGFDADNQAASMSGLIGLMVGPDSLPHDLLFPFPDLNWMEPFNDSYKNRSRYDMPDASLKDMALRMALQGENIILAHGGKKFIRDSIEYYRINTEAEFSAPLELPAGPLPVMEIGRPVNFDFYVSGGMGTRTWSLLEGEIPAGLNFENGNLSGTPLNPGIHPLKLEVFDGMQQAVNSYTLIVRGNNLAPDAQLVIANVTHTDTTTRNAMWLTVPYSLYANDLTDIIRDGDIAGAHSVFYSINSDQNPKPDYYGYSWVEPQNIGILDFHSGSMEENGGWFTSLNVEYLTPSGNWQPVQNLSVLPDLLPGNKAEFKAHFVEYLLLFEPVFTPAIRIIGDAGGGESWSAPPAYFTSITELSAYAPISGVEGMLPLWSMIDDKNPAWKWNGWTQYEDFNCLGGTAHGGMQVGAEGTFTFTSTGIEVYAWRGPDGGEVEIMLDGVSKGTFSLFNAEGDIYNQLIGSQTNLSPGNHTLEIRALNSGWTMIDYVRILRQPFSTDNLPSEVQLDQNYPNPFNLATIIRYHLPVDAWVTIKIYDLSGRWIRTFSESQKAAGENTAWWNGANEADQLVSSGVYFYVLRVRWEGNESTLYGKAVLLR